MIKITLAAARVNAGLTQKEAATKINKTRATVIAWETGKTTIDLANLTMLSNLYQIPVDNIILPN